MLKLYGYGDSNMWGWDSRYGVPGNRHKTENIWMERLARERGYEINNDSLPGRKIPMSLASVLFVDTVSQADWDVLFLMLGTNDFLAYDSIPLNKIGLRWTGSLAMLLEKVPEKADHIILSTIPPILSIMPTSYYKARDGFARVADQFGIRLFDMLSLKLNFQYDGVHLSERGHELLAKAVGDYLAQME